MDYKILAKGFLKSISDFGDLQQTKADIEGRKAKLQTDFMAHQFEAKNNFFWKMKEKNAQTDFQKKLEDIFNKQNGTPGTFEQDMTQEVFGQTPKPSVVMRGEGYEIKTPSVNKTYWLQLLQKKKELGMQKKGDPYAFFSPAEKSWHDKQMGIGEDSVSFAEKQRADIQLSVEKIQTGESNFQAERKTLMSKYPSIGWNTLQNLNDIEKMSKQDIIKKQNLDRQLRGTAAQELKKAGYPITENNIKNAMEQLRGQ